MEFFKNKEDEELWVRLNAHRQIQWEKSLTWFNPSTNRDEPTEQALRPRSFEAALTVSKNQLAYDKKNGGLRYTLEELVTLSGEELIEKKQNTFKKFYDKFHKK